jgi:beta-lactamase regulating signal transducer with metallopeptidase domain
MILVIEHLMWTSILAGIAGMICFCCRPNARTRYVIWLVVLLKLVFAPFFIWPFEIDGPNLIAWESKFENQLLRNFVTEKVYGDPVEIAAATGASLVDSTATNAAETQSELNSSGLILPTILYYATVIWICGTILHFMLFAVRMVRLLMLSYSAGKPSNRLSECVNRVAATVGVRSPQILVVNGIKSPGVFWFGRTFLFCGEPELQKVESSNVHSTDELVLMHEMAHIKRNDHLLGWLETAALIVWWWCPLSYLIVRELQIASEACCDDWVKELAPNQVSRYAHLLIDAAVMHRTPTPARMFCGSRSGKPALKFRLQNLLDTKNKHRRFLPAMVAGFGLFLLPHIPVFSVVSPIVSQSHQENQQQIKKPNSIEAHMQYLVCDGGKWRADNPQYVDAANQPKTFRYEFTWGTNKSIVKGRIIGESPNGSESVYSEMVVFWHPKTHELTLHQYGTSGEIGQGTTKLLPSGDEQIKYSTIDRSGLRCDFEYLNERIGPNQFVTHRKMKPEKSDWVTLNNLSWSRIEPDK